MKGGRTDGPRDGHPRASPGAGIPGGITILKDHLARVQPTFLAARAFQRTWYQPGEIGEVNWWHTGVQVPVGRGVSARPSVL